MLKKDTWVPDLFLPTVSSTVYRYDLKYKMYDILSYTRWDGLLPLQPSDDPLDPHPLEGGLHQDDAAAEGTPGK